MTAGAIERLRGPYRLMPLSRCAAIRCRQRAVLETIVEGLLNFVPSRPFSKPSQNITFHALRPNREGRHF